MQFSQELLCLLFLPLPIQFSVIVCNEPGSPESYRLSDTFSSRWTTNKGAENAPLVHVGPTN